MIGSVAEITVMHDKHLLIINSLYNPNNKHFNNKYLSNEFKFCIQNNYTFSQKICFDDEHSLKTCSYIHISLKYNKNILTFHIQTQQKHTSLIVTPQNKTEIENIYDDIFSNIKKTYDKWYDESIMSMYYTS